MNLETISLEQLMRLNRPATMRIALSSGVLGRDELNKMPTDAIKKLLAEKKKELTGEVEPEETEEPQAEAVEAAATDAEDEIEEKSEEEEEKPKKVKKTKKVTAPKKVKKEAAAPESTASVEALSEMVTTILGLVTTLSGTVSELSQKLDGVITSTDSTREQLVGSIQEMAVEFEQLKAVIEPFFREPDEE